MAKKTSSRTKKSAPAGLGGAQAPPATSPGFSVPGFNTKDTIRYKDLWLKTGQQVLVRFVPFIGPAGNVTVCERVLCHRVKMGNRGFTNIPVTESDDAYGEIVGRYPGHTYASLLLLRNSSDEYHKKGMLGKVYPVFFGRGQVEVLNSEVTSKIKGANDPETGYAAVVAALPKMDVIWKRLTDKPATYLFSVAKTKPLTPGENAATQDNLPDIVSMITPWPRHQVIEIARRQVAMSEHEENAEAEGIAVGIQEGGDDTGAMFG